MEPSYMMVGIVMKREELSMLKVIVFGVSWFVYTWNFPSDTTSFLYWALFGLGCRATCRSSIVRFVWTSDMEAPQEASSRSQREEPAWSRWSKWHHSWRDMIEWCFSAFCTLALTGNNPIMARLDGDTDIHCKALMKKVVFSWLVVYLADFIVGDFFAPDIQYSLISVMRQRVVPLIVSVPKTTLQHLGLRAYKDVFPREQPQIATSLIDQRGVPSPHCQQQHTNIYGGSYGACRVLSTPPNPNPRHFYMDSGACYHTTWDPSILQLYLQHPSNNLPQSVSGINASAQPLKVHGCGSVNTGRIRLDDVLFVPGSAANLVSVGQLAKQYSAEITFQPKMFIIRKMGSAEMIGYGCQEGDGNHYVLEHFVPN